MCPQIFLNKIDITQSITIQNVNKKLDVVTNVYLNTFINIIYSFRQSNNDVKRKKSKKKDTYYVSFFFDENSNNTTKTN